MKSLPTSLPLLPLRQPDEWVESYLSRVARAFGVKRPWRNDLELLRAVLSLTDKSVSECAPRYGELPIPDWAVAGRAAKIRYCPACFAEANYIRSRWRLTYFEVCSLHGIRLKDDLVEPAFTSNYKRPGRYAVRDLTVEQLWQGAICPLQHELNHAMALWFPYEAAVLEGDEERAGQLLAWTLLAERLIDALASSVRGIDYPTKDVTRLSHRTSWSRKFDLKARPTEEALLSMLDGLRLPAHRRAAMNCLAYLMTEEMRKPTCLTSLPLQMLHDKLSAASPENMKVRGYGALPQRAHPEGYLSFGAAEVTIGCPAGLLSELIRKKMFFDVRSVVHGRKQYRFIQSDEVFACRRWFHSLMSFDEVVTYLQIDRAGYWFLLRAGVLRPQTIACRAWFRRCDVRALIARLEDASQAIPEANAHLFRVSSLWVSHRGSPRQAFKDAFIDLMRGRLPLYKKHGETGLSAFFIDAETLEGVRRTSAAYTLRSMRAATPDRQLSLELFL